MSHLARVTACAALAAAALLAPAAARAGSAVEVTIDGTITSGTDKLGLFGPANASLAGDAYSLVIYGSSFGNYNFQSSTYAETSGGITGSVSATVDGVAYTAAVTNSSDSKVFEDFNSGLVHGELGGDNGAQFVSASGELTTFVNPDLSQPYSYTANPASDSGSASFSLNNVGSAPSTGTSFTAGTPTSIAYTPIPEPGSLGLFGAGLSVLGAVWMRRRGGRQS